MAGEALPHHEGIIHRLFFLPQGREQISLSKSLGNFSKCLVTVSSFDRCLMGPQNVEGAYEQDRQGFPLT